MKIGVISDIHAHFEPLKKAIALFESHKVDHIICAGDLVDGGWDEESVIDCIRSHNILSVRGNHDRGAYNDYSEMLDIDDDFDDSLHSYRARFIRSLPMTREFIWEGIKVSLAHGAPWSDTFHVFPNCSIAICQRIFSETESDIVVLGHTHTPMKIQFNNKWILNAGALCENRDNLQRTCDILELPKFHFEIFDVDSGDTVALETRIIRIG